MPIQPETRTDMRRTFTEVWRKLEANEPLSALEQIIADIIRLHPEYQTLLAQPDKSLDKDWTPEGGQTNPFLHMGLHIAIREQLSIDRPRRESRPCSAAETDRRCPRRRACDVGMPGGNPVARPARRPPAGRPDLYRLP